MPKGRHRGRRGGAAGQGPGTEEVPGTTGRRKGPRATLNPQGKAKEPRSLGATEAPRAATRSPEAAQPTASPGKVAWVCTPRGSLPNPDQLSAPAAQPSGLTALQNRESQRPAAADGTKQDLLRAKRLPRTAARAWGGDEKGKLPALGLPDSQTHARCLLPPDPGAPSPPAGTSAGSRLVLRVSSPSTPPGPSSRLKSLGGQDAGPEKLQTGSRPRGRTADRVSLAKPRVKVQKPAPGTHPEYVPSVVPDCWSQATNPDPCPQPL